MLVLACDIWLKGPAAKVSLVKLSRRFIKTFPTGLRPVVPSIAFDMVSALTSLFAEKRKVKPFSGPFLPPLMTVLSKLTSQAAPVPSELLSLIMTSPFDAPTTGRATRGGDTIIPLVVPLTPTNLLNPSAICPLPIFKVNGLGASLRNMGGALLQGFLLGEFTEVYVIISIVMVVTVNKRPTAGPTQPVKAT